MKNPVTTSLIDVLKAVGKLIHVIIRDLPRLTTRSVNKALCSLEGPDIKIDQSITVTNEIETVAICKRCETPNYYARVAAVTSTKEAEREKAYETVKATPCGL